MRGEHFATIGLNKRSWPFPWYQGTGGLGRLAVGHPACQDGAEDTLTLIPSLWTSALLSEEFWNNDKIPRKSEHFFHSIDIFRSENPYEAATNLIKARPEPVLMEREFLRELQEQGQLGEAIIDMIADWELREGRK